MPLIAVNLSDKLLQEIRELVDDGRYANLESFIEIGAFNQLALERGASPSEIIERGHRRPSAEAPKTVAASSAARTVTKPAAARIPRKAPPAKSSKVVTIEPVTDDEAKEVFSRFALPAPARAPALQMREMAPTGERIFGQVNRLFPFKLVCRWLASIASKESHWPKYTAAAPMLADDAGTIGSLLDEWDKLSQKERGSELATALPRRKNNASLDRFLSQFVARITRASEVSPGAVCQYDLARIEDAAVGLTTEGLAFAALTNPILDGHDRKAIAALSDDEAAFLAKHIRTWVPTEWQDMKSVMEAVRSGKASPNEVAAAVRGELPDTWTESMIQTHVSGVIARLGDIRLLRRTWQGRNVRYELGASDYVTYFMGN